MNVITTVIIFIAFLILPSTGTNSLNMYNTKAISITVIKIDSMLI